MRSFIIGRAARLTASTWAALAMLPAAAHAEAAVKWSLHSLAQPTYFQSSDALDQYTLLVENVGSKEAAGPITLVDKLPAGVTTAQAPITAGEWKCPGGAGETEVHCTHTAPIPGLSQGQEGAIGRGGIGVVVSVAPTAAGPLLNTVVVAGGGSTAETTSETPVGSVTLPFEALNFSASAVSLAGTLETAAAGRPAALTTAFNLPTANGDEGSNSRGRIIPAPTGYVKHIAIDLPPGLVGNPQAAPKCPLTLLQEASGLEAACPPATRIGTLTITKPPDGFGPGANTGLIVYNVVPERGYPAEFGVYEPVFKRAQLLYGRLVGTGATAHIQVVSGPLTEFVEFTGFSTIFYGDPAAKDKGGETPRPFFTNPSDCSQPNFQTIVHLDSWQHPGRFTADGSPDFSDPNWRTSLDPSGNPAPAVSPAVTGCRAVQFNARLTMRPNSGRADEPTAYEAKLDVPQNEDPNGTATPPLRTAIVTLPPGVAISPAAADGLLGCQPSGPEGIELGSTARGHCPTASSIGAAEVITPLLSEPLKGNVYLAEPVCGGAGQPECTEEGAETGGVFGLYLEIGSDTSGIHIKLPGRVEVGGNGLHTRETGLVPGQVRTTFADAPQQPFSELRLRFNGGPRAPLANPQACGVFTVQSSLTPWSASVAGPAAPSEPFSIGGCTNRFTPSFRAGTIDPQAGGSTPFTVTFSRHDREQDLSGASVSLPPGLLGEVRGVPQCPEAQANAGTCPQASRIGSVTAAAGAGTDPLWQSGLVYLTGPYKGGPFGLSFVVPAVAGPYHLGNIVVRAAIYVDPHTAQLTVVSDALPQSVDGVPLRLQTVNVTVDREAFMFNPTSCEPMQVAATLTSLASTTVPVASRFQAANCASLPFTPSFSATTAGNGGFHGAALDVKISQRRGEAAIHNVNTQLPLALPSRLETLQKACTEAQFATNPAGCPAGSDVGTATATTPVLSVPLTGPAYLVSHGGAAFPDLDIVLQGEGVKIILVGNTDIKKGITFSRFETVPDAPVSSFELNLPGGRGALLAATRNLCALTKTVTVGRRVTRRVHGRLKRVTLKVRKTIADPLLMPTTITGQNGAVVQLNTMIAVTGCHVSRPKARKKSHRAIKRSKS